MELSWECLKEKEVIVVSTGRKLGYPKDLIIDCSCGRVEALILCGRGGFFFQKEQLRIPWCDVERIGEDVLWICREPKC